VSWLAINDPRSDKRRMLLSIFTAAKLQVICLIFSTMVQKRCWLDTIAGASALKEPELNWLLAPIASEIRR
jgi:hypothetical protein